MTKIGGYSAYQNAMFDKALKKDKTKEAKALEKKNNEAAKADKAKEKRISSSIDNLNLSDKAKNLLQELKKKYENMDFIVADYESDEEAQKYLSRGTKEFSVLIDPEELERMAEDEEVKNKNLTYLDDAVEKLTEMKKELGENEEDVVHMGITIGSDGEMSFFAELSRTAERQKAFVEAMMESTKEQKKEDADKETDADKSSSPAWWEGNKIKKTSVSASSAEELLQKIRSVDWNSEDIPAETIPQKHVPGGRFDLSV